MSSKQLHAIFATILVLTSACLPAFGQSSVQAIPSSLDFKAPVVMDLTEMGQEFLDLAQAMPPEKYGWRPSGGASSSVSELFVLAATQYFHVPSEWGLIKASGYEIDGSTAQRDQTPKEPLEKAVTGKDQVIRQLFDAVSYFDGIIMSLQDGDLGKTLTIQGKTTTTYASLITMDGDLHEYLAQAITYARINDVALPWMAVRDEARARRGWRTEVGHAKKTN
jgi:hypothetical protein